MTDQKQAKEICDKWYALYRPPCNCDGADFGELIDAIADALAEKGNIEDLRLAAQQDAALSRVRALTPVQFPRNDGTGRVFEGVLWNVLQDALKEHP